MFHDIKLYWLRANQINLFSIDEMEGLRPRWARAD